MDSLAKQDWNFAGMAVLPYLVKNIGNTGWDSLNRAMAIKVVAMLTFNWKCEHEGNHTKECILTPQDIQDFIDMISVDTDQPIILKSLDKGLITHISDRDKKILTTQSRNFKKF